MARKNERDRRHDAKRRQQKPWRAFYKDPRWSHPKNGRRALQLKKQPLCERCLRMAPRRFTPATVANHMKPHRGDAHLFWNGKLESLCKTHHDSDVQSEEAIGYSAEIGADGLPTDPKHPFYASA